MKWTTDWFYTKVVVSDGLGVLEGEPGGGMAGAGARQGGVEDAAQHPAVPPHRVQVFHSHGACLCQPLQRRLLLFLAREYDCNS